MHTSMLYKYLCLRIRICVTGLYIFVLVVVRVGDFSLLFLFVYLSSKLLVTADIISNISHEETKEKGVKVGFPIVIYIYIFFV
ncbi:hypothetical protein DPX39_000021700 [Trypanosoma brucei equiperdum]|uniref:Uncharacterized protein n=1 Tax=Trypanosoma brucei equiperdum TaxID=630700 RepID=A0A3L6KS72_9TRYP|nr:hypothetical protein DPX39_000021700 [Trypanosoma brucei equiperdum]